MASTFGHVVIPTSIYLRKPTDNHQLPLRKSQSVQSSPPAAGTQQYCGKPRPHPRLLNVDEALQYSPLSSIVPLSLGKISSVGSDVKSQVLIAIDTIPTPNAHVVVSQLVYSTPAEQQASRRSLEFLNSSLETSRGQSELSQTVLKKLQSFLNQNAVTDFKFKEHGALNFGRSTERLSAHKQEQFTQMGPFATLLLNATDLVHHYPSPRNPEFAALKPRAPLESSYEPKYRQSQEGSRPENLLPKALHIPSPSPKSQKGAVQNDPSLGNGQMCPLPELEKSYPIVLIEPSTAGDKPIDHITLSDGQFTGSSRKRKRESEGRMFDGKGITKDQRAISDEAVQRLRDLLQSIFDAHDQSQQETSGVPLVGAFRYFVPTYHEGHELLTLAPAVHVKLEPMLQKIVSLQRYTEFPLDQLIRLQGLCEGALLSTDSSDFNLSSGHSPQDNLKWLQEIESFDMGLRSARTVLRLMTGGWQEKEVCSEELLIKVLSLVKRVIDTCLIPIVEARGSSSDSAVFDIASSNKKVISQLLYDANKVMGLLAELVGTVDVTETVITELEFLAMRILFVDNACSEKDSVMGIQKFEALRRTAMDLIAIIFSCHPEQQMFLVTEVLTSLQKLPVNKQQARQYKLPEGKSIQLVSALIMRLIQTSANAAFSELSTSRNISSSPERKHANAAELEHNSTDSGSTETGGDDSDDASQSEASSRYSSTMQRLSKEANRLSRLAGVYAQYVTGFYVKRATNVSKTGDQPHRNLLDLFVEDMIAVLGLPDWPAAELLLRALLLQMCEIAENKKYNASEKSMALELLGMMGSAISELGASVRHSARTLENHESMLSGNLRQILYDHMEGNLESSELLSWDGPYRAAIEYLRQNDLSDKHAVSAQGYILTQWAKSVSSINLVANGSNNKLVNQLRKLLAKRGEKAWDIQGLSSGQGRLFYALTVLNLPFCQQSDRVLKILLDSAGSEQSSVRTRSLKSVTQMLEQDPSLLDGPRNVKILILRCASDASSKVRDSALTLIGKCISLKPALEQEFLITVLGLANDPAILVKKRAMRLLQDLYLRTPQKEIKAVIADSLLQRVKDHDAGVADLARVTLEEIWFTPLGKLEEGINVSVQDKIALQLQIGLIVRTVQRGELVSSTMVELFQAILSNKSKSAATNFKICKALVAVAFEGIINIQDLPGDLQQTHILQTLTVFARANAKLFAPEQLQYLQPYITNLSSPDDLNIFRSVVIVFRCVLPILSTVQHGLLRDVQTALLHSIAKLGRTEIDEVAACLWTINCTLHDPEKLIKLIASVLRNLHALQGVDFSNPKHIQDLNRVKKYVRIAGYFGKHCDFEDHTQNFQELLPWWKEPSVAGLIVGAITPFAKGQQPLSLRVDAFDAIGLICQSWPFQFNQEAVSHMFEDILGDGDSELQNIVLSSFRDFFAKQERQAEIKGDFTSKEEISPANGKLGGSMTASDGDGASALIAQRFLRSVLQIALASQDQSALTATQVISSINRQGLVHPKESGPALVALESSTHKDIADIAFQAHRILHQQHESMFEREYMRAVQEAFKYQRDVVKDPQGAIGKPPISKLSALFDIIKTSKGKYQRKFLDNFCSKINFDVAKLNSSGTICATLQFSRFLIENVAFFEYGRMEELLYTISCMEKIVASTGSGVAHSISTDIFHVNVEPALEDPQRGGQEVSEVQNTTVDNAPHRLPQLATAAIILLCLWDTRTYLRRLYGLQTNQQKRESKTKASSKDLNKAPSRAPGVSGERLLLRIEERIASLDTTDGMKRECEEFVELLSVDQELKVAADGDEEVTQAESMSADEGHDASTPAKGASGPQKRKGSLSVNGSPQKKKRTRPSPGSKKRSGKVVDNDESGWD